MKETKELCAPRVIEAQREKANQKERLLSIWFSLSFASLAMSSESLLFAVILIANFMASAFMVVKHVKIEEE